MPGFVAEKLPFITKSLSDVCLKMHAERLKILKDNEEHIAEEEEKKRANKDSDEDDDGFVDEDDEDDEDQDDETEPSLMTRINKLRAAEGMKPHQWKEDDDDDDENDDDEDDSDYEYTGGDLAIYDSALDDVDELLFVKETLEHLNATNAGYTANLLSGIEH